VRDVLIVAGGVVVTAGVLALWVWLLGRFEKRDQHREADWSRDTSPRGVGDAPRHLQRRNHRGGDGV
jgi:hypothetical protein